MGERFAGRYELVDLLDTGGMGAVWRVWDERDQAYRAAKVLKQSDSSSLLRFVRETSWRIDHPHVVMPLGWVGEDDRVLFTMPLIGGGTVAHLIADYRGLPGVWVAELMRQLLSGLKAVHEAGLVHRDIKPGNLLLDPTGRGRPHLWLTDFGIATPMDEARLTSYGQVIGTPGFQAPEAAHGADPDPRQDLYAVGVVAWTLLSGRRPPGRDHLMQGLAMEPIGFSGLVPWVRQLTAVDPVRRISNASLALRALEHTRLTQADHARQDQIEVRHHIPPLPDGWTAQGPATTHVPATPMPATPLPATPLPATPGPASPMPASPAPKPPKPSLSTQALGILWKFVALLGVGIAMTGLILATV